jgi:hypothetical protein
MISVRVPEKFVHPYFIFNCLHHVNLRKHSYLGQPSVKLIYSETNI